MLVVAGSWELEAEEKTLYGEVAEAVLGALAPATIYQVRTFAENELGRSKEGRVVQVTLDHVIFIFARVFRFRYLIVLVKKIFKSKWLSE